MTGFVGKDGAARRENKVSEKPDLVQFEDCETTKGKEENGWPEEKETTGD